MTGLATTARRIVVTGGARGIGAAAAAGFVGAGARVALLDQRAGEASALVTRLGNTNCQFWHCNVALSVEVEAAMDAAAAWLGGIDMLINAAGLDRPATAEAVIEADWDLVMSVNAKGAMLTNKAALRHMRADGGRIVNFASIYGVRGGADRAAYSAAKAAVLGWTRAAARDWGRFGIAVNAVAPIVATEVALKSLSLMTPAQHAEVEAHFRREIPLGGHMGDAQRDLVPLLLFLAGPGAAYITGQLLNVDGGMMIG